MENGLLLTKPSKAMEQEIWAYRQEYFDYGESNINGSCGLARAESFDEWLETALSIETDRLRNGVHATTFFSIRAADGNIIGSIQLRHSLTPELKQHGGHIGYGVRPTRRGKGYGTAQLRLALAEAKKINIPWVMIICDKNNIPSGKTAVSCGGYLSGENVFNGKAQLIYWIDIQDYVNERMIL